MSAPDINLQAMLATKSQATMSSGSGGGSEFSWEMPYKTVFSLLDDLMGFTNDVMKVLVAGLNTTCKGFVPHPMHGMSVQGAGLLAGQLTPPSTIPQAGMSSVFNGRAAAAA